MGASKSGKLKVIFYHDDRVVEKFLNEVELTALLNSDQIFIDDFKEPKKVDKKIWNSHVNGMSLQIYLKYF